MEFGNVQLFSTILETLVTVKLEEPNTSKLDNYLDYASNILQVERPYLEKLVGSFASIVELVD